MKYDNRMERAYCWVRNSANIYDARKMVKIKKIEVFASGKPVLNTQTSKEYCKLVEDYEMGFNCLSEKPEELAEKIKILAENEELREKMGQGARRCAEEKFDRAKTYKKLVNKIKGLL